VPEGTLSPVAVIATVGAAPDPVPVLNGGYGSALARDPAEPGIFFLLTDRGPNVDGRARGQKLFPVPSFGPRIGRFRFEHGRFVLQSAVVLTARDGTPLSGLPQRPGPGSTNEQAVGLDGSLLGLGGFDQHGFDTEGLAPMADGSFWVSDEYGPYLLHVTPQGREVVRVSPFGGGQRLPAVLAKRRPNCGLEGLALLPDGHTLAGLMQCPLENPSAAVPEIRSTRLTRLLLYDTRTGTSRQYIHLLDHPTHLSSEIAALSAERFLVIERDLRWPSQPGAFKQIHVVDLRGATDVTGDPRSARGLLVNGKTLEEMTIGGEDPRAALARHGIRPASKTLVSDLVDDLPGWNHGVASGEGGGRLVRKTDPVSGAPDYGEIRLVRLKRPLR
jgi:hypothetical protein